MRAFAVLVLALALEMTVADFVAVQRLDEGQRRRHFGLPDACVPVITATRSTRGRMHVLVTCEPPVDETSGAWQFSPS